MDDNRTSRYTWTGSTGRATVFRRERPFGQDEIFAIRVPVLEISTEAGREVANLLPAAVDNMCDYLDRNDRKSGGELGAALAPPTSSTSISAVTARGLNVQVV